MFINRTKELKKLEEEYKAKKATFSVIYGRRRVGKTALIQEYIKDKNAIYLYITQGSLQIQLDIFTNEIKKFVDKNIREFLNFNSFEEALEFLATLDFKQKLVLVIDEYQYLIQLDGAFSSKLQRIWDIKLSNINIHLIICGSVLSMIQSEVLNYQSPLYGRRTSSFHIKPLKFKYIKEFIPNIDRLDQINIYASFGTIPKYLQEYDKNLNFMENIKEKILNKNSYLYSEGNFLLKDEIHDSTSYFRILQSIANGNMKIGKIASSMGVNSSYLSKYMLRLIELDIVEKEIPITETNPSKSKFGLYKIKDNFLKFWFYYIYKNYHYLEIEQIEPVLDEIKLNFNDKFVSFAFEDVIKEDLLENPLKYLNFIPKKAGRWWNNKDEIDIVAFDEKNIAFIECKWQNQIDKEQILQKLIQKSARLVGDKKAFYLVVEKKDFILSVI